MINLSFDCYDYICIYIYIFGSNCSELRALGRYVNGDCSGTERLIQIVLIKDWTMLSIESNGN